MTAASLSLVEPDMEISPIRLSPGRSFPESIHRHQAHVLQMHIKRSHLARAGWGNSMSGSTREREAAVIGLRASHSVLSSLLYWFDHIRSEPKLHQIAPFPAPLFHKPAQTKGFRSEIALREPETSEVRRQGSGSIHSAFLLPISAQDKFVELRAKAGPSTYRDGTALFQTYARRLEPRIRRKVKAFRAAETELLKESSLPREKKI